LDYQCRAIILKTQRLNEADKILHLYSPEHGPIRAIAKGALKTNSRLVAKSQVLNICDFLLASGRNLDIIREAKLSCQFPYIQKNYEALILASFFVDIFEQIAISDDNYQEPFSLINNFLNKINQICSNQGTLQEMVFHACKYLWLIISMLGYKPDLSECSITQKKLGANHIPQFFDYAGGAITSQNGYLEESSSNPYQDYIRPLAPGVYRILENFDNANFICQYENHEIQSALKLLHKHLEFRIHKEFKSWKLLEPLLLAKTSSPNDVFSKINETAALKTLV
jgi:DNA repair protein RecO (recombination protein O)